MELLRSLGAQVKVLAIELDAATLETHVARVRTAASDV
jgi:hypothetical protein